MRDLNIFYQERLDAVFGLRSLLFFYIFIRQQYRFCAHLMHCERRKINVYSSIWNVLPFKLPFLVTNMVSKPLIFKMKLFGA